MTPTWAFLPFGIGLFALVAQTVLFRVYLRAFGGSELAIGCFFGTWLLWIGLGAAVGRLAAWRWSRLARLVPRGALLYVPAAWAQWLLLVEFRFLLDLPAYAALSPLDLLGWGAAFNAPVSFVTGVLFPLLCGWAKHHGGTPPVVYGAEAAGAAVGGAVVTGALSVPLAGEILLAVGAAPLLLAQAPFHGPPRRSNAVRLGLGLVLWLGVSVPVGGRLADYADQREWVTLLPGSGSALGGRITTARGRYLYGTRRGQRVVISQGSTVESLPADGDAHETVAMHMAQMPTATRVLLIGSGCLATVDAFLKLPQIERVTWLHPDPQLPVRLLGMGLPGRAPGALLAGRLRVPEEPILSFLGPTAGRYDLIVVKPPPLTTLAANRLLTDRAFRAMANHRAADAVLSVRIPGGANVLTPAVQELGRSVAAALGRVAPGLALSPGESTWLHAGPDDGVTDDADVLMARWARIQGAEGFLGAARLAALYPQARVKEVRRIYQGRGRNAAAPLPNTVERPAAFRYALMREFAALSTGGARFFRWSAWSFRLTAILVASFLIYRSVTLWSRTGHRRAPHALPAPVDLAMSVFAGGAVAMGAMVVLLYRFQAEAGTLFAYIGLLSALFMSGACGGALAVGLRRLREAGPLLLLGLVVADGALLLGIEYLPSVWAGLAPFLLLALLCGVTAGGIFGSAASLLERHGWSSGAVGALLDGADHSGAAVAAVVTGLVFLPGTGLAGAVAALLCLCALPLPGIFWRGRAGDRTREDRWTLFCRTAGALLLAGTAGTFLARHFLVAEEGPSRCEGGLVASEVSVLRDALAGAFGGAEYRVGPTEDGMTCPVTSSSGQPLGRAFTTDSLSVTQGGFGGKVPVACIVDRGGRILRLALLPNQETPGYLRAVRAWLKEFEGRALRAEVLEGVDVVSGATYTSEAVRRGLVLAVARLADGGEGGAAQSVSASVQWRDYLLQGLAVLGAFFLRWRPTRRRRMLFLVVVTLVLGVGFNVQYSSDQLVRLVSLEWVDGFGAVLLCLSVPLLVIVFGNVYCGYLCPFGALQEVVGELRPRGWAVTPSKQVWRYGRAVKYLLLALLVMVALAVPAAELERVDPLTRAFRAARSWDGISLLLLILVFGFIYRRFWCRAFCPVGAFLALLGRFQLLRRWLPRVRPGACDLGVQRVRELDCIQCDRCRCEGS